jgi:hypothetical protein
MRRRIANAIDSTERMPPMPVQRGTPGGYSPSDGQALARHSEQAEARQAPD